MEIKQGDKVRVSKDAPKMYFRGWDTIFKSNDCNVLDVEDDNAVIAYGPYTKAVPTKYLAKIDAEVFRLADVVSDAGLHQDNYLNEDKKEPKFKVNDVVRTVFNEITYITSVLENGNYYLYGMRNEYPEDSLTLIRSYTEPTERTEAHTDANEKLQEEYMRFMKDCMSGEIYTQSDFLKDYDPSNHEVNPKPRCIPKIMFNTEFWVKYEADLAKELAIRVANRIDNPQDVTSYAVDIAKDIVKRLKQTK